ncbi:hypothetical protein [Paraflavitalea sp. CAU 1676]|uniref:hypothetical protein n=1 Tax=Paraflavitalea sp. CAU 1676 TaxID=3032598 RepID=UPI0023DB4FD3|nr:hypothetical protein [Paraflavitalea sp. CAU 1676]MDF2192350.1 hypothetical protein [Paraflavitalea sp. CAU 1676]
MVNLDIYTDTILDFIHSSTERFTSEHAQPSSIGIYCCPWAGWLTINFNLHKSPEETGNNCPDFEFVEYAVLDLAAWQLEYEQDEPEFWTSGSKASYDEEKGDVTINSIVFSFLAPLMPYVKKRHPQPVLLQLLDSEYASVY